MEFRLWKVAVVALACALPPASMATLDEPIQPIPTAHNQDPLRARIGRQLFNDVRLSGNGRVSCATCHDLAKGGGDTRVRPTGEAGTLMGINAPTVFNSSLNFKQFWNGRADTLESQIDHVVRNNTEMGGKWLDIVERVRKDPGYKTLFAASYKDGVTQANIQNALSTFERTLITPNSRFDKFLRGDVDAISAAEKLGYARFKQFGCIACHQGVNVGGNMFQKLGIMGDYFADRGSPTNADLGRYLVTQDERDRYVFKVPSLRNVALTAPYFHDGSAKTLEDAVEVMFRYQLGRGASREDKALIVQFLGTLTGELETRQ